MKYKLTNYPFPAGGGQFGTWSLETELNNYFGIPLIFLLWAAQR